VSLYLESLSFELNTTNSLNRPSTAPLRGRHCQLQPSTNIGADCDYYTCVQSRALFVCRVNGVSFARIDKFSNHSDWIFELEYDGFLPTSTFAGCVVSVAKCPP
jgi:hypothetical protein